MSGATDRTLAGNSAGAAAPLIGMDQRGYLNPAHASTLSPEMLRFEAIYVSKDGKIEEARKLFATGGAYNSKKSIFATLRSNLEENNMAFWPPDFVSERSYEKVTRIELAAYLETKLVAYWALPRPPPSAADPPSTEGAGGSGGSGQVGHNRDAEIAALLARLTKQETELAAIRKTIGKSRAVDFEPTSDIDENQDLRDLFRGIAGGNPLGTPAPAVGGADTAPRQPAAGADTGGRPTATLSDGLLQTREARGNETAIKVLMDILKGPNSSKEEGGAKKPDFIKDNLVKGLAEPKPQNLEWRWEDGQLTAKPLDRKPYITAAAYMLAADKIEEKHMKDMVTTSQTATQIKEYQEEHRSHVRRMLACFDVYSTESILTLDNTIRDLVHQKKRKFSDDYADLFVFHMTDNRIRKSSTAPNQWEPNKRTNDGGGGGGFKGGQGSGAGPSQQAGMGGGQGASGGKSRICDFFNKQKGCDRGAGCRFDHRCKLCKLPGHGATKCPKAKRD